jgi:hypothetical protein
MPFPFFKLFQNKIIIMLVNPIVTSMNPKHPNITIKNPALFFHLSAI